MSSSLARLGVLAIIALAAAAGAAAAAWRRREPAVSRYAPGRAVLLLTGGAIVFTALFTYLANLRYDTFHAAAVDLGIQHQVFWAGGRGAFLYQTVILGKPHLNHVVLLTRLLSYLSILYGSPRFLFALQAAAMAAAAFPAYLLARRYTSSYWLAAAFGGSLFFLVTFQSLALYDFHERTLAPALVLWALWSAETGRPRATLLFSFLSLMLLEEMGLYVAAMGLIIAGALKRRRLGLSIAGAGVAHFLLCTYIVYPQLIELGGPASNPILNTFGVATSPFGLVKAMLDDPVVFLSPAADIERWEYLVRMAAPWGFLPAFTGWGWLAYFTPTFYALFSRVPTHYDVNFQYAAPVVPFLLYFALRVWGRWERGAAARRPRLAAWGRRAMALYLIGAGLGNAVAFGPVGLNYNPHQFRAPRWAAAWPKIRGYVSPTRSLAASMFLLPHFSERWRVYLCPHQFRRLPDLYPHEVAVVTSACADPVSPEPWTFPSKYDWERDWKRYVFISLLREKRYGCIYADGDVAILRRGATPVLSSEEVFQRLFQYLEDRDLHSDVGVRVFDERARDRRAIYCPRLNAEWGKAASSAPLYWPTGKVRVTFRMAAAGGTLGKVADVVVTEWSSEGAERPVAARAVLRSELPREGGYGDVSLVFDAKGLSRYRFHVYSYDNADLFLDYCYVQAETLTLKDCYVIPRSQLDEEEMARGRKRIEEPLTGVPPGFQMR